MEGSTLKHRVYVFDTQSVGKQSTNAGFVTSATVRWTWASSRRLIKFCSQLNEIKDQAPAEGHRVFRLELRPTVSSDMDGPLVSCIAWLHPDGRLTKPYRTSMDSRWLSPKPW